MPVSFPLRRNLKKKLKECDFGEEEPNFTNLMQSNESEFVRIAIQYFTEHSIIKINVGY